VEVLDQKEVENEKIKMKERHPF